MGLIRSLGFTSNSITKIYMLISFVIGTIFTFAGMIIGYYFSYILLNNYEMSCHVNYAERGLSLKSFFMGVILVSIIISPLFANAKIHIFVEKNNKKCFSGKKKGAKAWGKTHLKGLRVGESPFKVPLKSL